MSKKPQKTNIMEKFYKAWEFLRHHKIFCIGVDKQYHMSYFQESLRIQVKKVNALKEIDKDKKMNTYIEVWVESGPVQLIDNEIKCMQDIDLDCGGKSYEEAIIRLSILVNKKYGNKIINDNFLL